MLERAREVVESQVRPYLPGGGANAAGQPVQPVPSSTASGSAVTSTTAGTGRNNGSVAACHGERQHFSSIISPGSRELLSSAALRQVDVLPLVGLGGAGVHGSALHALLPLLARVGATAVRTWGVDQLSTPFLDSCSAHGIVVLAGLWIDTTGMWSGLPHEGRAKQAERVEQVVRDMKAWAGHPAIAAWIIGNECETRAGNLSAVLQLIDRIAAGVRDADSQNGRIIITAVSDRADTLAALAAGQCPSVDVVAINAYSRAESLGDRLSSLGMHRPWMLLECGSTGHWEQGGERSPWGACLEPTSTDQAASMIRQWRGSVERCCIPRLVQGSAKEAFHRQLSSTTTTQGQTSLLLARRAALRAAVYACKRLNSPVCLGALSFLAGTKAECTLTWFAHTVPPLLHAQGSIHVPVVDKLWVLQQLWARTAGLPSDALSLCALLSLHGIPHVQALHAQPSGQGQGQPWLQVKPGQEYTATLFISHGSAGSIMPPSLTVCWTILPAAVGGGGTTGGLGTLPGGEIGGEEKLPGGLWPIVTSHPLEHSPRHTSDAFSRLSTPLRAPSIIGQYRLYAVLLAPTQLLQGAEGAALASLPVLVQ